MGLTICLTIGIVLIVLGFTTMQVTQSERAPAQLTVKECRPADRPDGVWRDGGAALTRTGG